MHSSESPERAHAQLPALWKLPGNAVQGSPLKAHSPALSNALDTCYLRHTRPWWEAVSCPWTWAPESPGVLLQPPSAQLLTSAVPLQFLVSLPEPFEDSLNWALRFTVNLRSNFSARAHTRVCVCLCAHTLSYMHTCEATHRQDNSLHWVLGIKPRSSDLHTSKCLLPPEPSRWPRSSFLNAQSHSPSAFQPPRFGW